MKIKFNILFVFLLIINSISCKQNKEVNIEKRLIGTWEITHTNSLDSIHKFHKIFEHSTKEIVFKENNQFSLKWMDFDVGNQYEGKYQILQNENRGLPTLVLIPDTIISDNDTIRMKYTISDIKFLTDSKFQLIYETEFIRKNDSITKEYVRKEMYLKKK